MPFDFSSYAENKKKMQKKPDDMITSYQQSIPNYTMYDGIPFPGTLVTQTFERIRNFEVREDDILIAGYPRSGNHWLKELLTYIASNGEPLNEADEKHVYERMPILECAIDVEVNLSTYMKHTFEKLGPISVPLSALATSIGMKSQKNNLPTAFTDAMTYIDDMKSPRVYHTHLPFHMIPEQAKEGGCKIIVMMRNGKDVATSYYNLHKMYPTFGYYPGSWKEFLFSYLNGKVCFGSWFDHILGWWEQKKKKNILFVKYEDLSENLQREVKRIADFLGKSLTPDQIDAVVDLCSFDAMRQNPNASYDKIHESVNTSQGKFLNKGKVGAWKSKYTVDDSEFFDVMYELKMADNGPNLRFEMS